MRIIFAGTPEFARVAAACLHAAGHEIALVLSQPDRPAGRGMKLQASPVKQWAQSLSLTVAQPRSLRLDGKYPDDAAAARDAIVAARADVMVVAAYGLILPQWVLDMMEGRSDETPTETPVSLGENVFPEAAGEAVCNLGCLNIHGSLLPRWRGAAPIHRAIEAGDVETGITIMQMDAGLDTGDMLLVETCPIDTTDTTGSLHDKLSALGGQMIVQSLKLAADGGLKPVRQPVEGVTYAHKVEKAEAAVRWQDSAELIGRRIRAFNPFPVASTHLGAEVIKLYNYEIDSYTPTENLPGGTILTVNEAGVRVVCGQGVLRLTELQRAGGKRLPVADFLRGFVLAPGMVLGG
jgi:methionyl-tRNA formyltransferase